MSVMSQLRQFFARSKTPGDSGTPPDAIVSGTTEARVVAALYTVVDPEIGINVVDLGLIYGVRVSDHLVHVTMTMTTPACPLGGLIKARIRDAIRAALPDSAPHVRLVWDPPWSAARVSRRGRELLGFVD